MSFFEVESNGQSTSGGRLWVEFDLTVKRRSLGDVVFEFQTLAVDDVTLLVNGASVQTLSGSVGSVLRFVPLGLEVGVNLVRFEFASPRDFLFRQTTPPQADDYVSVDGYRHNENMVTNGSYILAFAMEYTAIELLYVPINQDKYIAAYVVDGLLDRWFQQTHWPVSETPLSQWLMNEVSYVKPAQPRMILREQFGQGWPVWSNSPTTTTIGTTVATQNLVSGEGTIPMGRNFIITSVLFDGPARLRLYRTLEGRVEDSAREFTTPYLTGSSLLYDYLATAPVSDLETPAMGSVTPTEDVIYYNLEGTGSATIFWVML